MKVLNRHSKEFFPRVAIMPYGGITGIKDGKGVELINEYRKLFVIKNLVEKECVLL